MTVERSTPQIHSQAVVDPKAELGTGVVISSGAVIGPQVVIGDNTWIGPNVVLDGRVTLGKDNRVFPGACLGQEPQDLKYRGANTEVVIGDGNTLREFVTINRATEEGEQTRLGDRNLLMAYCHLGHNCLLGNGIVMSNAIQAAGHVVIEDRAVIGGCIGIHQFVHIGGLAMIGGMTRVIRDIPPYAMVEGHPGRLRGLNRVGLQRSGLVDRHEGREFKQLKFIWNLLYRSDCLMAEALEQARSLELLPAANHLCSFLEASTAKGRRGPTPPLSHR